MESEGKKLDDLISEKLKTSDSKIDVLRDLLMAVFADTRFLFYSDVEQAQKMRNYELVGRWLHSSGGASRIKRLFDLASRDRPITDPNSAPRRTVCWLMSGRTLHRRLCLFLGRSSED